jgi:hypothetical protein
MQISATFPELISMVPFGSDMRKTSFGSRRDKPVYQMKNLMVNLVKLPHPGEACRSTVAELETGVVISWCGQ